jgi:PAS domain S-box-containing protein
MKNLKEELYNLIKNDYSIFQYIEENALDGFWYINADNLDNVSVNTKFWSKLGLSDADIPLTIFLWKAIIYPEDLHELNEKFLKTYQSFVALPYSQTIRYKHKNGSTIWMNCRAIVIKTNDTNTTRILCTHTDVTELKRKEEFLERCNAAAIIGYWELDLETQKLYWSKTTKLIYEVEASFEPDVDTSLHFYQEGESRDMITQLSYNAFNYGQNFDSQLQIITANNKLKWVRTIGETEFSNGKCVRLYGTVQDIHNEKIAKQELIKEKQKLQSVLEGTNAGTWEWNIQTGKTIHNERWAEILGYTLDELPTHNIKTWSSRLHPEDLKISNQKIKDCFENKVEFYHCEYRIKHKDGHWVWVRVKGKVINWTNDDKPLMMYGTLADISEQKQIAERNIVFIENTPTAIAMFDNNIHYLAISDKWRTDYGLFGIDLIGKSHYEIFPEIGDEWKNIHAECLKGKTIRREEDKFIRIDGREQWLKWEVKPWYNDDGSTGGLIMFTEDISEKKAIEQVLLEKNALLETILDSIDVGIVACDQDAKLTLFNTTTTKWHGLPIVEVEPSKFSDYYSIHDMDGKTLQFEETPLIRTLKEGTIKNFEIQILPKNGENRIVSTFGSQLRGPNNELFGAVIALHDITKTKKALEDLKISEEAFRGNFENAAIGMALLDPTGRWLKINKNFCDIVGYKEEELFQLTFKEITHPDDLQADLHLFNELIDGKRSYYQMEKRYVHKKGHSVHIILAASLVRDHLNTPLYFVSQIIDITQQKEAEFQLQEALSKRQALFDSSSNVSIIGTDTTGLITIFNKGAENLLGYQKEEVLYKKTPTIIHIKEEVQQRANELSLQLNRKIEGFETFIALPKQGIPDTREWTYIRKDGTKFPVQLSVTAVRVNDEIVGYMGIAADISEIKRVEKEIQSLLDVTKDQNERLKNFAHIVSHNLRSHSGNISMMMEILLEEAPDLLQNQYFNLLHSATQNLNETIAHLNEVVLMNTSLIDNLKTVQIYYHIENAIQIVANQAKESNINIENNVSINSNALLIPAYFDSIILNFLTNSIKYSANDRESYIKLSTIIENDYLVLRVEDNGLGIDLKKHGAKLFGMYKTFHDHKDARGVGLFITKNQIEAMGGKIEVTSEINKGTVFSIYLKYEKI